MLKIDFAQIGRVDTGERAEGFGDTRDPARTVERVARVFARPLQRPCLQQLGVLADDCGEGLVPNRVS